MEWVAVIFAALLGLREWVNSKQKANLKEALSKTSNKLAKEKTKNARAKSKKAKVNYHKLRDAYGRFRTRGSKGGRS